MNARELFQAGKLNEAVQALGAEVRDNPTDVRRRTFLFELLCFQGEYDRAEMHLHVLADAAPDAQMGAILYFSALHAERVRHGVFSHPPNICREDSAIVLLGLPLLFRHFRHGLPLFRDCPAKASNERCGSGRRKTRDVLRKEERDLHRITRVGAWSGRALSAVET